jgi:hypothetical protein
MKADVRESNQIFPWPRSDGAAALPPEADIRVISVKRSATDPMQTLGVFGLRNTFFTFQKRTTLGQSEIRPHPA